MKIAVVGPSPIPYVHGGAEKLMSGLCSNINKLTGHQAELIKIPVREDSFWPLIEAYHKFYTLDLSWFDLIITLKYPSWMVRHPNSICWMMHTLRGLYDTYPDSMTTKVTAPEEEGVSGNKLRALINYMDRYESPASLDSFFDLIGELRDTPGVPERYLDFPGAFIRKLIHYMDNYGLKQQKKTLAISETVKRRCGYFPLGMEVNALYPPIDMELACTTGEPEYFFTCSRLDAPKRMDTLIEAYKKPDAAGICLSPGQGLKRRNWKHWRKKIKE